MRSGFTLAFASLIAVAAARAGDIGVPIEPVRYVNNNGATDSPTSWGGRLDDQLVGLATDGGHVWVAAFTHVWDFSTPVCIAYDLQFARSTDDGMTWSNPAYLNPRHQVDDPNQCVFPVDAARGGTVVTDRHGNWLIYGSYIDGTHGDDGDLTYWRSTDNGVTWSGPMYLNSDAAGDTETENYTDAKIVARFDHPWVAVWDRWVLVSPGQYASVLLTARSFDAGATWTDPVRMFPDNPQLSDSLPATGEHDGILSVTWERTQIATPGVTYILESLSFDEGEHWTTPNTVIQDTSGAYVGRPSVAMIDGAWLIAYSVAPNPNIFWDRRVRVTRSTNWGGTWSAPVEVAQLDTYNNTGGGHRIAGDKHGNVFLFMTSDTDASGALYNYADTYVMRSRNGGESWSQARQPFNSNFPAQSANTGLLFADASDDGRWLVGGTSGAGFDGSTSHDTDPVVAGFRVVNMTVVDPNPNLLDGAEVTTDIDRLADGDAPEVVGLAADGVTRVLLRMNAPSAGTVTLSLSGANEQDTQGVGWLAEPGGTSGGTTLSVGTHALTNSRFAAFAVLRAPREFTEDTQQSAGDVDHMITVSVVFHPSGGGGTNSTSKVVYVERPPVVFMHGIWSSALGCWGDGTNDDDTWPIIYSDERFSTTLGDYSQSNAYAFVMNRDRPRLATRSALAKYRKNLRMAATQVDYVGHSMGGLLGRRYAAGMFHNYIRNDNYGLGDFRKLVTVDTPHWGTPVANVVDEIEQHHPICRRVLDAIATPLGLCLTCGAVGDLRTDSLAISALPPVDVPTHAIAGLGGQAALLTGLSDFSAWPAFARVVPMLVKGLELCGADVPAIFGPVEHDLLVPLPSQSGGLPMPSQVSEFDYVPPPNRQWGVHVTVNHERRVGDEVLALLDTPTTDLDTWGRLPSGNPSDTVISLPQYGLLRPGLSISLPGSRTLVHPGDTLPVTVDTTDGFIPTSVHVQTAWGIQSVSTPPYIVTLNVPLDAIGSTVVHAFAFDSSWNLAEADVTVTVDVPATLNSITINPDDLVLYTRAPSAQLAVIGHYADGVDRDLTASELGTVYWSDDPSVLTVDADGVVTAAGVGTADVYAQNGTGDIPPTGVLFVRVLGVQMKLSAAGGALSWTADDEAASYDLIRGDLNTLRSGSGDFTPTVSACLASKTASSSVNDAQAPAPGQGWYYLLRPRYADARDPGTWDEDSARQLGSRDAGIAASPNTCP